MPTPAPASVAGHISRATEASAEQADAINVVMDRYAQGDDDAFGELYDLLAPRLMGYLRKLVEPSARQRAARRGHGHRHATDPVRPHLSGLAIGVASGAWGLAFVDVSCPIGHPTHVLVSHVAPLVDHRFDRDGARSAIPRSAVVTVSY